MMLAWVGAASSLQYDLWKVSAAHIPPGQPPQVLSQEAQTPLSTPELLLLPDISQHPGSAKAESEAPGSTTKASEGGFLQAALQGVTCPACHLPGPSRTSLSCLQPSASSSVPATLQQVPGSRE